MFTAIAIALSALTSDISHTVSEPTVIELAPITIVADAPSTFYRICQYLPGESSPRACRTGFFAAPMSEVLAAGRAYFGPSGIVTAEVSK